MKKSIIFALAMAVPAFAGEPATTVYEYPTPAPAYNCPLSLEVGPTYTYGADDLGSGMGHLDMGGVDITAIYDLSDKWAITLRGSWAKGDASMPFMWWDDNAEYPNDDVDAEAWSLMVGVRYTAPITEKLSWFAGAQIGATSLELKNDLGSDDEIGISYSVEAGLKYDICDKVYVYGAIQATGCHASPSCNGFDGVGPNNVGTPIPVDVDDQYGIGVRAGVGIDF